VFTVGTERGGFAGGVRLALTALLHGAPFFYRVELGTPVDGNKDLLRPTSWEMASRLSYLFLASMPDAELMAAAEADALVTPAQIEAQARRLAGLPQAVTAAEGFFRKWLHLQKAERPTKEVEVFPRWHDTKGPMFRESCACSSTRSSGGGSGRSRPSSSPPTRSSTRRRPSSTTSPSRAVTASCPRAGPQDPRRRPDRVGLLGRARPHRSDLTHRAREAGARAALLPVADAPPPDLDISVPSPDRQSTTRERLTAHMGKAACQSCHGMMDPIGFGLEHYDGVGLVARQRERPAHRCPGRARGHRRRRAVRGRGRAAAEAGRQRPGARLRGPQWFRYAFGREEESRDARTLNQIGAALDTTGGNLRQFLVALTQTDAFRYLACTPERCPEARP
jgi:hypothetical protein